MGLTKNPLDHSIASDLNQLLDRVRNCTFCASDLPLGPRPVLRASPSARILLTGQAPGTAVHASGIPWDDPSGRRLRQWMGISDDIFYDESRVAIIPMGFCYPGKGKSGDLAPRPECATLWHQSLLNMLPNLQCHLLIGQYAHKFYLPESEKTVTARVSNWRHHAPKTYVMPHPSPRNQMWLKRNPWFEMEAVPHLRKTIKKILSQVAR